MSTHYKSDDKVPGWILRRRLDELANAVTQGRDGLNREFSMRVPAEKDRDADLVISEAAKRLKEFEVAIIKFKETKTTGDMQAMFDLAK